MCDNIVVNVSFCSSKQSLHELFASVFNFPGFYGMNWDAFRDCINDPELSDVPNIVMIKGINILKDKLPNDADILIELFEEMVKRNPEKKVMYKEISYSDR